MKNSKKLILMSALAALFGVAGVGTLGAAAEEMVNPGQPASFVIEHASTIRTESPFGIRFTATISAEDHNDLVAYAESQDTTVEYGMLIIPEDLLGGETLDANDAEGNLRESYKEGTSYDPVVGMTNNYEKIVVTPTLSADGKTYSMTGGIKNLNANNVSRDFAVRGYVLVDGTYYYTESFERSIYTAATYAIDALDAASDVAEYLNRIVIDRVEAAYTQASVEIKNNSVDAEYGLARVGDTIDIKGYVSNGKRTLESKATLADTTNLTHVSGGTYKVTGMGGIDTTVSVGTTSSITNEAISVKENYATIDENVTTAYPWTKKWGGADAASAYISYVEEHQGMKNVVRYANFATEGAETGSARFLPLAEKNVCISAGKFYVMDVCLAGLFQFETYNGKNSNGPASYAFWSTAGGSYTVNSDDGAPFMTVSWYDLEGNTLSGSLSAYANKWVTIQVEFHQDCYGLAYYRYHENATYHNYFANFRLQDYAIQEPELHSLTPTTDWQDAYAAGETIEFTYEYKDALGRIQTGTNSIVTVTGTATAKNNVVTVGLLGNSEVSATLGEKTISYPITGPTQFTVNQANITNGHYVDGSGGTAKSSQTVELLDSFMGIENVAHIYGQGGATWAVGFSDEEETATSAARYMYVQILVSQNWNLYTNLFDSVTTWTTSGSAGKEVASDALKQKISFYKYDGSEITVADNLNPGQASFATYYTVGRWMTVEYKDFTLGGLNKAFLSGLNSYATGIRHIYIKSVIFSTERLVEEHVTVNDGGTADDTSDDTETKTYTVDSISYTDPRVEADGTLDLIGDFGVYMDSRKQSYVSLVKTTLGNEEVYEWKYLKETLTSGVVTAVEQGGSLQPTALMINSVKYKGASYYLYLDIYIENTTELTFELLHKFGHYKAAQYGALYGASTDTTYSKETLFDANGKQLEGTNLNNYQNQWITVQIQMTAYTAQNGSNGFTINNVSDLLAARQADLTNANSVPRVYFKTIELTTTKRTFTQA